MILIPGWFNTIFHASGFVTLLGISMKVFEVHESTLTFAHNLWSHGAWAGAILLIVYAVVIPVLKVVLLAAAEVKRYTQPASARFYIQVVQCISKWACPDMFAYICLYCMINKLDHEPIVIAGSSIEEGFSCYCIFCVASTMAVLAVRKPP